jgi:hypothetical protein
VSPSPTDPSDERLTPAERELLFDRLALEEVRARLEPIADGPADPRPAERGEAAPKDGFSLRNPAATYSPAPSPGQYHRRWKA